MKSIYVTGENPDLVWLVVSLLNHHNPNIQVCHTVNANHQISRQAVQALSEFGLAHGIDRRHIELSEHHCDMRIHIGNPGTAEKTASTHMWHIELEQVFDLFNPYRKALYELNCKVRVLLAEFEQADPITPMAFYKAMSDELRLKTLLLILQEQELCVCELMVALDEPSQPKVSRHLAQLRKAGILTVRKQSQWVYYALNAQLPGWMQQVLQRTLLGEPDCIAMELARLAQMGDRPARQQSCCV
ncbi:metalloregulator ArsR/SmtB family transcription factor [Pseudoalteromonas sp. OOF1S-7]|uniref:metalloregulator ArsR/SmtB family transcription factor n=1 Tax=Pseudoalteromonas sp. OOF1S-7 TaxID=2917757 RepID=UPI001EF5637F|nr:metalloregulator ArsR/SmtB family transcription factor [Pseudoalteromonas sp. OOF1S-7]